MDLGRGEAVAAFITIVFSVPSITESKTDDAQVNNLEMGEIPQLS